MVEEAPRPFENGGGSGELADIVTLSFVSGVRRLPIFSLFLGRSKNNREHKVPDLM